MTRRPGFVRRILIEPANSVVSAELEDDYHRMAVSLVHDRAVITSVVCEMKRAPWTTCPGATDRLEATLVGTMLADVVRRGEKAENCTHLYDLAIFAASHATGSRPIAYEAFVSDEIDGRRCANILRDGELLLDWTLESGRFRSPAELAGSHLMDLGGWISSQDAATAEAGRILRWVSLLAQGRAMTIPAGLSATAFPLGTCYTFQPERAVVATRLPNAEIDFSISGLEPMQDRAAMFGGV